MATPRGPEAPGDDANANANAEPDVEQLRAERDALAEQVDTLKRRRHTGTTIRRTIAVLLVTLYALTFVASGVGIWVHRSTLNRDVWAERVVPLGEDPAVQAALANWTTEQIMQTVDPKALFQKALPEKGQILAIPLSSAVEGYVRERVDAFYASERFVKLWSVAAVKAHDAAVRTLRGERTLVTADSEKVQINMIPLIDAVLNDIIGRAPGLLGADVKVPKVSVDDLPDAARKRLSKALGVDLSDDFGTITIYDGGTLESAQTAVRLFDKLIWVSSIVTVLLAAAAIGMSDRRRRTILQILGVTALACIAIRRLTFTLQGEISGLIKRPDTLAATRVILLGFVRPLTNTAALALWIVGILVLIAVLTGPYPWVRSLRQRALALARAAGGAVGAAGTAVADRAQDDQTVAWVHANVDGLRIAGWALGGILFWFTSLSWVSFILIVGVVAAWQLTLTWLVGRAPSTEEGVDAAGEGDPAPSGPAPATGS